MIHLTPEPLDRPSRHPVKPWQILIKRNPGDRAPRQKASAREKGSPGTVEDSRFISRRTRPRAAVPAPKITRVSMAPRPIERNPLLHLLRKLTIGRSAALDNSAHAKAEASWRATATRRRLVLLVLVLAQTLLASWSLARTFPAAQLGYLPIAVIGTFAILFSWISFSFWTNVAGFCALWCSTPARDAAHLAAGAGRPLRARTAVLMPICEEEVGRCFTGIEVMYRSLSEHRESKKFDFYVLSDTQTPERQVEEEIAWAKVCRAVSGFGRIFYRRRRVNIKRKSGNIADFVRRWARNYDYMIVLDADSIMTGETMVRLARMMQAAPQVGIIQTTPTLVNRESLFARMQQFASRVYGPLFSASLDFWQQGESYYWGHNAIIRIEPFVKQCALARLPGRAPLGGEILSHDFVEAALMGRAGQEVWLALDLPGSYEESPPSLLDELKRDRRWCQGNLQHLRLILSEGFKTGHRAILAMGVMAYVSALFWAAFLLLNIIQLVAHSLTPPDYFSVQPSLFPTWPHWRPEWAIALASTTALLLFLPKVLSFLLILKNGEAKRFGGGVALATGIAAEIVLSTLLAPARMWCHSKFVLATLAGVPIKWNAQQRTESGSAWSEAAQAHGFATIVSAGGLAAVFWFQPAVFVWLLPIGIPLLLSIPLSVYSSRVTLGRASRRWGLFCIPEEKFPPPVLERLQALNQKQEPREPSFRGIRFRPSEHRASVDARDAAAIAQPLSES